LKLHGQSFSVPPIFDFVAETTYRFQGDIDGFVAGSKGMARGGTAAVHQIFPVEVYLNGGNKALTESTGSISIRFSYEGAQYDCVSSTRFISRLENVGGEWKLLTLDAIYDRDSITPVLPRAPVDFPFPPGARESYKCIAWVLSQKGFAIKDNLPGNDSPASCEQLMKEGFEWLLE
jgi:hypothetical protein